MQTSKFHFSQKSHILLKQLAWGLQRNRKVAIADTRMLFYITLPPHLHYEPERERSVFTEILHYQEIPPTNYFLLFFTLLTLLKQQMKDKTELETLQSMFSQRKDMEYDSAPLIQHKIPVKQGSLLFSQKSETVVNL